MLNQLRMITENDATLLEEFKQSFQKYGETSIDGANDFMSMTAKEWIAYSRLFASEETVPAPYVPNTFFVLEKEGSIIGIISIRHRLNSWLEQFGGHIGYSVRPDCRRQGYATAMLKFAVAYAQNYLGIDHLLVTCDVNNMASEKVILANGGVLDNIVEDDDERTKRFWITRSRP